MDWLYIVDESAHARFALGESASFFDYLTLNSPDECIMQHCRHSDSKDGFYTVVIVAMTVSMLLCFLRVLHSNPPDFLFKEAPQSFVTFDQVKELEVFARRQCKAQPRIVVSDYCSTTLVTLQMLNEIRNATR